MIIPRAEIVDRALRHLGHAEVSPNRSPLIDEWLRRCGLDPGNAYPWCAAFASWCISDRLSADGGRTQVKTAGALALGALFQQTREPRPGDLMFFPTGGGKGHCGIVEHVSPDQVLCIEGNSENRVRRVRRARAEVSFAITRGVDGGATYHIGAKDWPPAPLVHVTGEGTR